MTRRSSPKKGRKVISLYSGTGGLDYGFEAAGFDVGVAHDFDKDSCETLRTNRDFPVLCNDIHDTSSDELLGAARLNKGEAAVLIGGPPCQPFSKSGYWTNGDTKRLDDPRAQTLEAYMRVVQDTLPEVFLLENVYGIRYTGKEEGLVLLEKLTARLNREEGTNYRTSWRVLNAADYGVPQLRERFFLVAHRDGGRFQFPEPTHGDEDAKDGQLPLSQQTPKREPYATAWEAISGVKPRSDEDLEMKGRWAELLPSIPEGENYLWHTPRKGGLPLFGWRTRYWSFLLKLAKNKPSWTIQAQPGPAIGPFHWENRRLSVEEMARLQTFPKNLRYVGSRGSLQRQLGNAVPSLLAEVLGRAIGEQFFGMKYDSKPELRVRRKRPIPPAETVRPVPKRFLHLQGDHPEHPGEGKGRAAIRRLMGEPLIPALKRSLMLEKSSRG
jgi:DNA (cytosine-5)-methyltransferase 1